MEVILTRKWPNTSACLPRSWHLRTMSSPFVFSHIEFSRKRRKLFVLFESEFNITKIASIPLNAPIVLTTFTNNGTQEMCRKFVIINLSPYQLSLDGLIMYAGYYAPSNETLQTTSTSFHPYLYYDNATYTLFLNGMLSSGSLHNLTVSVAYNQR